MQKAVNSRNHGLDRTQSGATTPVQSGPESNGNEGVMRIPQSYNIAGTSPSDCLVSYPEHSLSEGSYPSAEKQSVYSTAPADWASNKRGKIYLSTAQKFKFFVMNVLVFLVLKKIFLSSSHSPTTNISISISANGPGDQGSIPGQVIPKTLKMVLDTSLLNTQHYKVRIKGKVDQSRARSCALPYTSV